MTPKDQAILKAIAEGCTYKEAGEHVHRAVGTIRKDLERLRATASARNTTHLIALAIRQKLI